MKILFVADAGSIHTQRWLEYFHSRGDDVHVASFRPCDVPGVTLHLLSTSGMGKLGYFFALGALRKAYVKVRPDLVHAHHLTSYGFLAAIARLHPLIVTAWGSDALIAPRKSVLQRFFASFAVRHADVVTTLAEHMNSSVAKLGISEKKIIATPFGVDTNFFRAQVLTDSVARPIKLICTRLFDKVYDVETLVRALDKVFSKGYRFEIDLTGDGPLKSRLVGLIRELQLDSYIRVHGFVGRQALADMLGRADIFVTPSLSDGNNVSLNEAMACGCFPIASNIPANVQWIKHGINGLLYPPGDVDTLARAIETAINNSALRGSARVVNRQIAETQVDWQICARRMEDLYQRLVERKG
jgi:glycosyltransferase involved in cell wall biosynthesis